MPGKSRRRRDKYSPQSKKKRGKSNHPPLPVQPSAIAQADEPVSSPNLPVPKAGVPTPRAKPAAIRSPYITTELRTIGILAGIMLIVLVVLALLLS